MKTKTKAFCQQFAQTLLDHGVRLRYPRLYGGQLVVVTNKKDPEGNTILEFFKVIEYSHGIFRLTNIYSPDIAMPFVGRGYTRSAHGYAWQNYPEERLEISFYGTEAQNVFNWVARNYHNQVDEVAPQFLSSKYPFSGDVRGYYWTRMANTYYQTKLKRKARQSLSYSSESNS